MTIETKLFQGDCLEIMKDIPAHSVDMILCDLPYGTTRCKWDSVIPFDKMWEQYLRVVKENGCITLFADEPFASALIMSNPKLFRYELIWVKDQGTDFLNANRKPLKKHEKIEIFYQKQPCYNKQLTEGRPYKAVRGLAKSDCWGEFKTGYKTDNFGTRNPTTILEFNKERGLHPTQKPVALCEWLIKTYTERGQTILDNCMGSGTTGVACVHTDRSFIGIELDECYFEVASERIKSEMESGLCETKALSNG